MNKKSLNKTLTFLIASVWLINGIFCKILDFVPRHQQIVEKILDLNNARNITILIGFFEVLMAIWILSRYKSKINAIAQISIVLLMNILEFIIAPNLLLWGKLNLLFSFIFCVVIYFNEFILVPKSIT